MKSMIDELNANYEKWGEFKFKYDNARYDTDEYDLDDIIYYAKKFNYYKGRYTAIREIILLLGLTIEYDDITARWIAHN